MWKDDESEARDFLNSLTCRFCNSRINLQNPSSNKIKRCDKCHKIEKIVHCTENNHRYNICIDCQCKNQSKTLGKRLEEENETGLGWKWLAVIPFLLFVIYFICSCFSNNIQNKDIKLIVERLRKDFPSQKNDTWYQFLYMLEKGNPSVKSITFLHNKDLNTSVCLTKKLVSLFNSNLDLEEVTFSPVGYETKDYGFALEHYRHIVEEYTVLVTDLNNVSGNIARIFHSLCDEVSSNIKPSLFIFTLKSEPTFEKLKPIERATTTLRRIWSNLPENELTPILSRVIKNVVDVIPEKQIKC